MINERNVDNGKHGALDQIFERNRIEGEEIVESIRLEEEGTTEMAKQKSHVPEKVCEAPSIIVRLGDSAGQEVVKQILPDF